MQAKRRVRVYLEEYVAPHGFKLVPHILEAEDTVELVMGAIKELRAILTPDEFKSLALRLSDEMNQLSLYGHSDRPPHLQVNEV